MMLQHAPFATVTVDPARPKLPAAGPAAVPDRRRDAARRTPAGMAAGVETGAGALTPLRAVREMAAVALAWSYMAPLLAAGPFFVAPPAWIVALMLPRRRPTIRIAALPEARAAPT